MDAETCCALHLHCGSGFRLGNWILGNWGKGLTVNKPILIHELTATNVEERGKVQRIKESEDWGAL